MLVREVIQTGAKVSGHEIHCLVIEINNYITKLNRLGYKRTIKYCSVVKNGDFQESFMTWKMYEKMTTGSIC